MIVAGVDEAGRGPLAGPVVAAAVVLDPGRPIDGLDDSKKLSPKRREQLAEAIRARARAWAIGVSQVAEIDRINILQATFTAMQRAVVGLGLAPDEVRVDGNRAPDFGGLRTIALVGGDGSDPAIAAASILAKVQRDQWMVELDARFPGYGFARHKGYGTRIHLDALQRLGPCAEHRQSFAPVRQLRLL
ncbi:MAG: ribonuclease HII [Wenzhouxiangellaceae bacterium]|nr:ribonuclease HII [Wenzhouxiangellaceae bacterium]